MNKEISAQAKFLSKPLTIVILLILMFVSLFVFGLKQIRLTREKLASSEVEFASLSEKFNVLNSIPEKLSNDMTFFDVVLPNKSALLFGLNQVKQIAVTNNLAISNLKTSSLFPVTDEISKAGITFSVAGSDTDLFVFFDSISKALPLMSLDKVKIVRLDGVSDAAVALGVYSSEFPKKIPSLTSPVIDLTDSEARLIQELEGYSMPSFSVFEPMEFEPKEDPFN